MIHIVNQLNSIMRFQVPQFIEIEDKVVGPFTVKQFIYVVGGAFLCYLAYEFLPIYIAILIMPAVGGLALALAFYRINNKPFIDFLESAFEFYMKDNLYIWKKEEKKVEEAPEKVEEKVEEKTEEKTEEKAPQEELKDDLPF